MKKSKKLGAVALCALVSASTLTINPEVINSVKADSYPELVIPTLQSTYAPDDNGYVSIPEINGAGKTTTIYPLGSDTPVTDLDTDTTKFKFKPTAKQYNVVYSGIDGEKETKKSFIISIDYKDATFSLDESSVIMPETAVKGTEIILPYPILKDADGNKIALDYGNNVKITVSSKSKSDIDVVESDKQYTDSVKYKKFTPASAGSYTVKYTVNVDGYDEVVKTYTIKAEPNLNTKAEISFDFNGSFPTLTLNKECTIPTVTAKDKTNELENIKVRVDVSYYVLAQNGTQSEEFKIENYKFTPKLEGYYVFKYKVTDAFGNESKTKVRKISTKVVDTQAPTNVLYTGSYKVQNGEAYLLDGETVTSEKAYDLSCRIPTNVNINTDFSLPAIFAKDNDSFEKLTFVRTLKRYEGGQVKETIDLGTNDTTKMITVKVTEAGTYKLTYKVIDSKGNETNKDFTINVLAGTWTDTIAPTIAWTSDIDTSTKWGSVVKISKPTTTDLNDAGATADKNLENIMHFYYKYKQGGTDKDTSASKVKVQINSSNKYEYSIYKSLQAFKDALNITTDDISDIKLVCEFTSIDDNGNNAKEEKEISILGNTEMPNVVYSVPSHVINQQEEYELGTVTINYPTADIYDEYLKDIEVTFDVVNKDNKSPVITYGSSYSISGGVLTVSGTKFLATFAGEYEIVLTVKDVNGNTFVSAGVTSSVAEIANNGRVDIDKEEMTIELGSDDTSAKIYTLYKNGVKIDETADNFKIDYEANSCITLDANKNIVAKKVGTATITFKMYNDDANDPSATPISIKTLTVTVQDTEKPEMIFEQDNPFDGVYKSASDGSIKIDLPIPTVSDKGGINADNLVIKVTHNGSDVTITDNKFAPLEDGTYTVEYKVTDLAGNSTTKTFSVGVGDLDGPSVDIKNVPASKEVGSIYTVDINDLVIYDEYEETFTAQLGVNTWITLKDSSGNEIQSIKDGEYSYKLDKAGTYTLTIKSTDSSNKTTTIDKTIVVSEAEPEPEGSSVAGTVIAILASLLLLAFVIYLFFKPEKTTSKSKNKVINKPKEDKNTNKDNK